MYSKINLDKSKKAVYFCSMNKLLLVILTLFLSTSSFARDISGVLVDGADTPLPFATITISGTTQSATSDEDGRFIIETEMEEALILVISSLGYQRTSVKVEAGSGDVQLGKITMREDMLGLDEVVITGTMRETFVKASPIKVEVIKAERLLNNIPAVNLMDGLQLINGVQEVNACGVCFTNSISINGLPGPYTAVLMDGTPIYGNLASVYGLNGIPTQMIDRFEVVKGPSSTLYGSEAIAGVINIITKDPQGEPLLAVDVMGTSHLEGFGNIALAAKTGNWSSFSGINFTSMNQFQDFNDDGFGDRIGMDRLSLFSKWSLKRPDHKKFMIAGKLYLEDRWNGVRDFFVDRNYRTLRGNDSIYGESIYTQRGEVFGTYDLPGAEDVRVDYSLSWHDQDSYYGSDLYMAQQGIGFANLVWTKPLRKHTLTSGVTQRVQFYDDNTVATNEDLRNNPERQYIPGAFIEDEWSPNARWTLLGGMRLDHYVNHGLIPSPRVSVKMNTNEWTSVRLNAGTGFKIVNLFTEDHAFITGQRTVELKEQLDPERSWNTSLNFNHIHSLWNTSGMFDMDVYYTRFSNKIVPDYDTPNKIIYANANGLAESYGLAASFNQQFSFPLAYNIGINLNRATTTEWDDQEWSTEAIPFAPLWSGVFTLNYRWERRKVDFAYTTTITGPMSLPEVFDLDAEGEPLGTPKSTTSQPFSIHNIQITKQWSKRDLEIYGGVQNIFNFRQTETPLVGLNDPNSPAGFSPYFDTSYSYGSIHGREFFLGLRFQFDPKVK